MYNVILFYLFQPSNMSANSIPLVLTIQDILNNGCVWFTYTHKMYFCLTCFSRPTFLCLKWTSGLLVGFCLRTLSLVTRYGLYTYLVSFFISIGFVIDLLLWLITEKSDRFSSSMRVNCSINCRSNSNLWCYFGSILASLHMYGEMGRGWVNVKLNFLLWIVMKSSIILCCFISMRRYWRTRHWI